MKERDPEDNYGTRLERTVEPVDTSKSDVLIDPLFVWNRRLPRVDQVVYQPLDEVLGFFQSIAQSDDRRGITAVLRIMDEQLRARDRLAGPRRALWVAAAMSVFFLLCLLVLPGKAGMAGCFTATLIFVAINAFHLLKERRLDRLYAAERREIERSAASLVAELAEHGKLPRRLYRDDRTRLDRLTRRFEWFRPVRDRIVTAAESR